MMIGDPSPSGAADTSCRTWQRTLVLCTLGAAFAYSIAILAQQWKPPTKPPNSASDRVTLEVLLFRSGSRLDLYSTESAEGMLRSADVLVTQAELDAPVRLLSMRTVLIDAPSGARVRDVGSRYSYDPAPGSSGALLALNRSTRSLFTVARSAESSHLVHSAVGCGVIADIPLPARRTWYAPRQLFAALGIELQRAMTLSPAETSLFIVDHASAPRIAFVRLVERTAQELDVPGFAEEQVHFSPLYIDEETLLFSVLDRTHWGTVLYRINAGTYETLSEAFTDRAYRGATGKIILVQSFYDDATNIPFGSALLLAEKRLLPLRQIETILAPVDHARALQIRSLLFYEPQGTRVRFRDNLSASSFNEIEQPDVREQLRALWSTHRATAAGATGVFHLLAMPPQGPPVLLDRVPFSVPASQTAVSFTEDSEPLLRALELPKSLIEQYRTRNAAAKENGESYRLVDAM